MPWKKADTYNLGYSIVNRQFIFYFHLENENVAHSINVSAPEMTALSDMFRNEGPMFFNTDGNYFATATELVGEGEN
jgi:hypothetical protein